MKLQRFSYGEALVFDTFILKTQWSYTNYILLNEKILRIYLYLIVFNNKFITFVNISDNNIKQYNIKHIQMLTFLYYKS